MHEMNKRQDKEIFQMYGDPADPQRSKGLMPTYNLTNSAAAKPIILWEDMLLTCDVYAMPGAPIYAHIFCPQCARNGRQNMLTIRQEAKEMSFDPKAMPAALAKRMGMTYDQIAKDLGLYDVSDLAGVLSVEKIGCTWEEDPSSRRGFGFATCSWSVVIDNNIAKNVPR